MKTRINTIADPDPLAPSIIQQVNVIQTDHLVLTLHHHNRNVLLYAATVFFAQNGWQLIRNDGSSFTVDGTSVPHPYSLQPMRFPPQPGYPEPVVC